MRTLFSNGTEADTWQGVWCNLCVHDHDYHEDGGTSGDAFGCEVWLRALNENYPPDVPEFVRTPVEGDVRARWYCTEFEPCTRAGCGGDDQAKGRSLLRETLGR